MKEDKAAAAAKRARMKIMQGDKWRKTRPQRQRKAAQNGDQVKGDKAAAAKSSSE